MKPSYLTLTDGRSVRIEWNMNALEEFTRTTGKEMTDLAGGKSSVSDLRMIAWCSAIEGEAANGKELGLTEMEFGRLMSMANIIAFSEILTSQSATMAQKKSQPKGRSPLIFFRNRG
jgi:hypothetical protein